MKSDNGLDAQIPIPFKIQRQQAFTFFSILVMLIVVYWQSFNGVWQYDDFANIVDNSNIHLKSIQWGEIQRAFYGENITPKLTRRPLAFLSFALNYYFQGLDTFGYHVVNFLVHFIASIFLFLFLLKTLQLPVLKGRYETNAYSIALLTTFFWASHPINVTAVTYIVQRMAAMAAMFYIAAMYFYLKARAHPQSSKRILFFFLTVMCGACALLTKENAAMLPIILYLYDLIFFQTLHKKSFRRQLMITAAVFGVFAVTALVFADFNTITNGYKIRPFTLTQRLLTEPRVILFYISLLLYPVSSRLTLLHDVQISTSLFSPLTTLPAVLVIVGLVVFGLRSVKKYPILAFCILFFLFNHAIEGSFIPLELIFEHRNYLPGMLFFLPVAIALVRLYAYFQDRLLVRSLIVFSIIFLIVAQAHTAFMRNSLFLDARRLWKDNCKKSPLLSIVHMNLGCAYYKNKQFDLAYKEFLTALDMNRFMNKRQRSPLFYNLGLYYTHQKHDHIKALKLYEKAMKYGNGYPEIWQEMSTSLLLNNNPKKALHYIEHALKYWPQDPGLMSILAFYYFKTGQYRLAEGLARKLVSKHPDLSLPFAIRAEIFRRRGKFYKSIMFWRDYQQREPQDLQSPLAIIECSWKIQRLDWLYLEIGKLMIRVKPKNIADALKGINRNESIYSVDEDLLLKILQRLESIQTDLSFQG